MNSIYLKQNKYSKLQNITNQDVHQQNCQFHINGNTRFRITSGKFYGFLGFCTSFFFILSSFAFYSSVYISYRLYSYVLCTDVVTRPEPFYQFYFAWNTCKKFKFGVFFHYNCELTYAVNLEMERNKSKLNYL